MPTRPASFSSSIRLTAMDSAMKNVARPTAIFSSSNPAPPSARNDKAIAASAKIS